MQFIGQNNRTMSIPALTFEAKIRSATRRSNKSGDWFSVTLEVHPSDFPDELHSMAVDQQQVQIGMAKVGDDGQPEPLHQRPGIRPSTIVEKAEKPRTPWHDKNPSFRAAMMCKDPAFWRQMDTVYSDKPELNTTFKLKQMLRIESRAELDKPDCPALAKFAKIERAYLETGGKIAEKR